MLFKVLFKYISAYRKWLARTNCFLCPLYFLDNKKFLLKTATYFVINRVTKFRAYPELTEN
ncbi:hypothetical protein A8L34_00435 [Bacillus sp. FJAT-27264]|nr:hypothetical protein A8L34_00435 [Bacillus sp. FJAT-27264]